MILKLISQIGLSLVITTTAFAQESITIKGSATLGLETFNNREVLIQGEIISNTDGVSKEYAQRIADNGFLVLISDESQIEALNCDSSLFKVSASEGNFIPTPNGFDYYIYPKVLEFICETDVPMS